MQYATFAPPTPHPTPTHYPLTHPPHPPQTQVPGRLRRRRFGQLGGGRGQRFPRHRHRYGARGGAGRRYDPGEVGAGALRGVGEQCGAPRQGPFAAGGGKRRKAVRALRRGRDSGETGVRGGVSGVCARVWVWVRRRRDGERHVCVGCDTNKCWVGVWKGVAQSYHSLSVRGSHSRLRHRSYCEVYRPGPRCYLMRTKSMSNK